MDDKKYLSLEEYYTLETFDVKAQELKNKQEIQGLKNLILQKDIALFEARIKELKRDYKDGVASVQTYATQIENMYIQKDKYKNTLQDKYELPKDWGFLPDTLEIILGE